MAHSGFSRAPLTAIINAAALVQPAWRARFLAEAGDRFGAVMAGSLEDHTVMAQDCSREDFGIPEFQDVQPVSFAEMVPKCIELD
jgi:hypothetical protein